MVIVVKLKNSDTEFHLINFTESNNPNKPYAYLLNVENNGFRRELWDNVKFFCYLDEKGHRYDAAMNKIKPSKTIWDSFREPIYEGEKSLCWLPCHLRHHRGKWVNSRAFLRKMKKSWKKWKKFFCVVGTSSTVFTFASRARARTRLVISSIFEYFIFFLR